MITEEPWKVIIADDDYEVHAMTRLVLNQFSFHGREVALYSSYNGDETKKLLIEHPDAAVMLLDIVMERDNTGLEIVRYIRQELGNELMQILIRTGQPSGLSEEKIFEEYNINAFKDKTELTSQRLKLTLMSLLRSHERAKSLLEINSELQRSREALQKSLNEKEVLLQEIHHRVKNNMQIVSSLLNLQLESIRDPEDRRLFQESERRVRSMAMVHEKLYQSKNFSSINFGDYIKGLIPELCETFGTNGGKINIDVQTQECLLTIEEAVPGALILNELISNALKYAFPDGTGIINVELGLDDDRRVLRISDNGIGMPEDFNIENADSLGLRLVQGLAKQLSGDIQIFTREGCCVEVRF